MAKTAWGIEAGTSNVKAVKLAVDGRGAVTLEDVSVVSLANYRSTGADDNAALLGALREFVQDKGIRPSDVCYISLPGRNAFSRVVELPPVGDDKIRETIANEARGQIPIKLEEAVWDYQRISSDSGSVEVNLYAVKRDVVDTLMGICRMAGLPVRGIQLAPLGIYNFVKHELDETISNGCVCIDIGTENTDLVVVDGEKAYLRVVPTAGNDITKALMVKDSRLKPAMAEALKCNPQAAVKKFNEKKKDPKWPDVASVLETMKTPLRDLVGDIHRSVGFYKNSNPDAQTDHLVMMGNGSRLLNLDKFLRQQLQFDVTRVAALSSIGVARGLDPAQIAERVPTLVVPIGLALQAVGVGGVSKTNLIPDDMIIQEQLSRTRPMAVLGGAIVAICGIAAFLLTGTNSSAAENQIDTLNSQQSSVEALQKEWNKELERDDDLLAMTTTRNNIERGDVLPMLTYNALEGLIAKFEAKNNVTIYRVTDPDSKSIDVSGLHVSEDSSTLDAVTLKAEVVDDKKKSRRKSKKAKAGPTKKESFGRTSTVIGVGNFAIRVAGDEELPGANDLAQDLYNFIADALIAATRSDIKTNEKVKAIAAITGDELTTTQVNKEIILNKGDLDKDGNKVKKATKSTVKVPMYEVATPSALFSTLIKLGNQAAPFAPKADKEASRRAFKNAYLGGSLRGNLVKNKLRHERLFLSARPTGLATAGAEVPYYLHFRLDIKMVGAPWTP